MSEPTLYHCVLCPYFNDNLSCSIDYEEDKPCNDNEEFNNSGEK